MAKLKNFTLDGEALRLTAYEDHHGEKYYSLDKLPEFGEKAMTGGRLLQLVEALRKDVEEWNGVINRCAGGFTNPTLSEFFEEPKDEKQEDEG